MRILFTESIRILYEPGIKLFNYMQNYVCHQNVSAHIQAHINITYRSMHIPALSEMTAM